MGGGVVMTKNTGLFNAIWYDKNYDNDGDNDIDTYDDNDGVHLVE